MLQASFGQERQHLVPPGEQHRVVGAVDLVLRARHHAMLAVPDPVDEALLGPGQHHVVQPGGEQPDLGVDLLRRAGGQYVFGDVDGLPKPAVGRPVVLEYWGS